MYVCCNWLCPSVSILFTFPFSPLPACTHYSWCVHSNPLPRLSVCGSQQVLYTDIAVSDGRGSSIGGDTYWDPKEQWWGICCHVILETKETSKTRRLHSVSRAFVFIIIVIYRSDLSFYSFWNAGEIQSCLLRNKHCHDWKLNYRQWEGKSFSEKLLTNECFFFFLWFIALGESLYYQCLNKIDTRVLRSSGTDVCRGARLRS